MKLRPYQQEARDRTLEAFKESQAVLVVLATGLGKTVIASHIADHYKDRGQIMLLAHREELISQGKRTLERVTGMAGEIEMADSWATRSLLWNSGVICSTIQTQIAGGNGGRMTRFNPNDFALVIVDEAHHATAPSYRKVMEHYRQNPAVKILGLTATPDRADEQALGQVFDDVSFEYDIADGIEDGWLVPVEQQAVYVEGLDFSEMRTTAGDLNGADLARVLEFEENLHGMTTPILDLCGDEKTLIFTATVAQAERMAEILNRHKPDSAEYVSGGTPKDYRRDLFKRYAQGDFQHLANVGVTTEGFDEPGIRHVIMARPTKSRSLYAQMIGRGTRPLPGLVDDGETPTERRVAIAESAKPTLTVLDFVGNAGRHILIHATDVLGGRYDDEIVELAERNIEDSGKPTDVASELVKAEREIERRRRMREEAAERAKIKIRSKHSTARVNPFDVFDTVPARERAWHKGRQPSAKQIAFLEKNGVDVSGLSFAHASQLIDRIIKNREAGKPTFKQSKLLRRFGYDPNEVTFQEATTIIDRIAANGWRRVAS
jgi:superfamily II DNA or RNA helicase